MLSLSTEAVPGHAGSAEPPDVHHPISWFDQDIPNDFLREVVEMLFGHYAAKDQYLARFPNAESHDLWPQYRRALIERDFRDIALRHGLGGTPELNTSGNAFHTVVSKGLVMLTESYVEVRGYLPRPAEFRNTLTRTCQGELFPDLAAMPDPSGRVYAMLTHGVHGEDNTQPGFADILFPALDGQNIVVADKIRLFEDRFAALVAQYRAKNATSVAPEDIKDDAKPRFRSQEELGG
jgi:hypothetical protein